VRFLTDIPRVVVVAEPLAAQSFHNTDRDESGCADHADDEQRQEHREGPRLVVAGDGHAENEDTGVTERVDCGDQESVVEPFCRLEFATKQTSNEGTAAEQGDHNSDGHHIVFPHATRGLQPDAEAEDRQDDGEGDDVEELVGVYGHGRPFFLLVVL